MKFLLGDFARGFVQSASEEFDKTRERNEKLVNAGVERAMTMGTDLWKERRDKTKMFQERIGYLETRELGKTVEQKAYLASLSEDDWNEFTKNITQFENVGLVPPDIFPDTDAANQAIEIKREDIINRIMGTPALAAMPQDQENQLKDSFRDTFAKGLMQAGVISATPAFRKSRVLKEAAALMPEVDSAEQLRRLLAQEDVPPAAPIGDVGYKPLVSPMDQLNYALKLRQMDQLNQPPPPGQLFSAQFMETQGRRYGDTSAERIFSGTEVTQEGVRIYDVNTVDKATANAVGNEAGRLLQRIAMPLNVVPPDVPENTQHVHMQAVIEAASKPIHVALINDRLSNKRQEGKVITNTNQITVADLREAGANETEAAELATEAGTVSFGGTTRREALQILAMLNNIGVPTGEGQVGTSPASESILTPTYTNFNLSQPIVDGLKEYYRAIIDGDIIGGLSAENVVAAFNAGLPADTTDVFGALGEFLRTRED